MCRVGVSENTQIGGEVGFAAEESQIQIDNKFSLEGVTCLASTETELPENFRDFKALAEERDKNFQVSEKRLIVADGQVYGETVADQANRLNSGRQNSQSGNVHHNQDPVSDSLLATQDFSRYGDILKVLPVGCTFTTPNGTSWVKDQNGNLLFHTKTRKDDLWNSMNTSNGQPTSDLYQMTQPGEFVQLQNFPNKPDPTQKPQAQDSLKIDIKKLSGATLSETLATVAKNKERVLISGKVGDTNLLLVQDSEGGVKAFVGGEQGMQQVKAEQLTFGKSSSNWFKISVPGQGEFEILKPGAFAQGVDAIPSINGIKLQPLSVK